jgi:hypothetical protein
MKLLLFLVMGVSVVNVQEEEPVTVPDEIFQFPIPGLGKTISIPEMVVELPWQTDPATCATAECNWIRPFTSLSCGCEETLQPTTMAPRVPILTFPMAAPSPPLLDGYKNPKMKEPRIMTFENYMTSQR